MIQNASIRFQYIAQDKKLEDGHIYFLLFFMKRLNQHPKGLRGDFGPNINFL